MPVTPSAGAGIFNLYNAIPGYSAQRRRIQHSLAAALSRASETRFQQARFRVAAALNSLLETPINFAPEWQIAGRFDWNVGTNDRAFVRIQYDHGVQPSVTDPINPVFNITSDQPEWQTQINETHTFSPTLVNQLIVAGTWYSAIFQSPNQCRGARSVSRHSSVRRREPDEHWRCNRLLVPAGPQRDAIPGGRRRFKDARQPHREVWLQVPPELGERS